MVFRIPNFQTYHMELFPITGGILRAMDQNEIGLKEIKLFTEEDQINDYNLLQSYESTQKLQFCLSRA
jgi:hypothetical protein